MGGGPVPFSAETRALGVKGNLRDERREKRGEGLSRKGAAAKRAKNKRRESDAEFTCERASRRVDAEDDIATRRVGPLNAERSSDPQLKIEYSANGFWLAMKCFQIFEVCFWPINSETRIFCKLFSIDF